MPDMIDAEERSWLSKQIVTTKKGGKGGQETRDGGFDPVSQQAVTAVT